MIFQEGPQQTEHNKQVLGETSEIEELNNEELQRTVGGAGPIVPDSGPGFESMSQQRFQRDQRLKRAGGLAAAAVTTAAAVGVGVGIWALKH